MDIKNRAAAILAYAKQAYFSLKIQDQVAEIKKVRDERRAGELLGEMGLPGGDSKSNSHDASLKLHDVGINKDKSSRWRQ